MGDASPDALIGCIIRGRYRILEPLASGGMAQVYRAEQRPSGPMVAVKVHQGSEQSPERDPSVQRFVAEAATLAKLHEPHTVRVLDYGQHTPGLCFIVMELIEGRTLSEILQQEGALDAQRALRIAIQIARALREAHAIGVIHRDLKPSNIIMTQRGHERDFVKVVDFGLSKDLNQPLDLTATGTFYGAPPYISPEQVSGTDQDQRLDIYSLGIILYQMFSGRVPFDYPKALDTLMAHMEKPVPPLTIHGQPAPELLSALVLRCLAKTPDGRWPSMQHLLPELERALQDLQPAPDPADTDSQQTLVMTATRDAVRAAGHAAADTQDTRVMTALEQRALAEHPAPARRPAPAQPAARASWKWLALLAGCALLWALWRLFSSG
ncbi:MAG: serine/threonine protein kinase [Proteobacteria bacterium]|nr:serine/threonine protein kinase [Pseudomonadota bacterium]